MKAQSTLKQLILRYDDDKSKVKLALYEGDVADLTFNGGCTVVRGVTFYVSQNLLDGTVVEAALVPQRDCESPISVVVRDIKKFGSSDLSSVTFKSRFELLDLLLSHYPDDYGFKIFGGRCVAPYVYLAIPTTMNAASRCQDRRVLGVVVVDPSDVGDKVSVLTSSAVENDVDGILRFPPVPDESKRVKAYEYMVKAMIRKMCGKWRDVYKSHHTPGLLPYSADDLMSQGLMEVTIAMRKYNANHASKAKESTFIYQHLWNRFGHIAHKYSKKSRGYGVHIVRDTVSEEGQTILAYDSVDKPQKIEFVPKIEVVREPAKHRTMSDFSPDELAKIAARYKKEVVDVK